MGCCLYWQSSRSTLQAVWTGRVKVQLGCSGSFAEGQKQHAEGPPSPRAKGAFPNSLMEHGALGCRAGWQKCGMAWAAAG